MLVVAACGGAPRGAPDRPAHPQPDRGSQGNPDPRSGAAAHPIEPHASGARPGGANARDCDNLIRHAVSLGVAERPADQQLTADERAALHAQLRTQWTPKCEAMTSRGYHCALAATSLAELEACGG